MGKKNKIQAGGSEKELTPSTGQRIRFLSTTLNLALIEAEKARKRWGIEDDTCLDGEDKVDENTKKGSDINTTPALNQKPALRAFRG